MARHFHALWFTPRLELEGGARAERPPRERAAQLAGVAAAVYEAGGRGIHLPLEPSHPLVSVLRAALGVGARGDLKKEWRAGREVSAALLEACLAAEEEAEQQQQQAGGAAGENGGGGASGGGGAAFPALLALHALVVTDVALCLPPDDPARFARALSPYLKTSAPPQQPPPPQGE